MQVIAKILPDVLRALRGSYEEGFDEMIQEMQEVATIPPEVQQALPELFPSPPTSEASSSASRAPPPKAPPPVKAKRVQAEQELSFSIDDAVTIATLFATSVKKAVRIMQSGAITKSILHDILEEAIIHTLDARDADEGNFVVMMACDSTRDRHRSRDRDRGRRRRRRSEDQRSIS